MKVLNLKGNTMGAHNYHSDQADREDCHDNEDH